MKYSDPQHLISPQFTDTDISKKKIHLLLVINRDLTM